MSASMVWKSQVMRLFESQSVNFLTPHIVDFFVLTGTASFRIAFNSPSLNALDWELDISMIRQMKSIELKFHDVTNARDVIKRSRAPQ